VIVSESGARHRTCGVATPHGQMQIRHRDTRRTPQSRFVMLFRAPLGNTAEGVRVALHAAIERLDECILSQPLGSHIGVGPYRLLSGLADMVRPLTAVTASLRASAQHRVR
jgi:hypothetical protein